jgi:hypothetical protein
MSIVDNSHFSFDIVFFVDHVLTLNMLSLFIRFSPVFVICLIIGTAYWFYQFFGWINETRTNLTVRRFYSDTLKLSEATLKTLKWNEVTNKMVEQSLNGVTALQIVNRIMREDNFFIAMINQKILRLFISLPVVSSDETLTQTLFWSLQVLFFFLTIRIVIILFFVILFFFLFL